MVELFCKFGPAKILQSNNGRGFTASVIENIKKLWPDVIIIHRRPHHPQSRSLIERGNGDLQLKLGKWMNTNGESCCKGLKFVIHTINTSVSRITSKSPYEVVFGQTNDTSDVLGVDDSVDDVSDVSSISSRSDKDMVNPGCEVSDDLYSKARSEVSLDIPKVQ